MQFNRVKKAFTLIELMIVIILISVSYYLVFSNSNFKISNDKKDISFVNIKKYLFDNFEFQDELSFICINEKFTCYVRIDGQIDEKLKIENFFETKPDVYEYKKEEQIVDYEPIDINNISQDVIFELKINSDYKSNDIIIDTLDEKVYLFNSIFNKVKVYNTVAEVFETFNTNQLEVQDAF